MYRFLFVIGFIIAFAFVAKAQTADTVAISKKDTIKKASHLAPGSFAPPIRKEKAYHPDSLHSPHKAVMHSLMIPGWGQLYNHQWWKVPIIYGGVGLLVTAVLFNQKYYNQYLGVAEYKTRGVTPGPTDKYYAEYVAYANVSAQSLYDAADGNRRNRDLSIFGILAAWGIQTIDAYIDAKFIHSYTVDNNLTFKVTPGLINQPVFAQAANTSFIPAIKINFTF
ncbi:MAG: hypothetical protein JWR38_2621 [Mucilaginibacter sp.]|nr:hypothetical protein [Mucilaginibacter sp.]